MCEENGRLLAVETEILKPLGDSALHLLRRHTLAQVQITTHDLEDGAIGDRTTERGACALELDHTVFLETTHEFIEQARLSDTWFTRQQHDGAFAGGSPVPGGIQDLELARAADERRQPTVLRHFEPRSAVELSRDRIGADGLGFSFDLKIAEVFKAEEPVSQVLRTPARDDLAGFGDGEQPRGEVGRVTDRGVVHAKVATDGPDDDGAG